MPQPQPIKLDSRQDFITLLEKLKDAGGEIRLKRDALVQERRSC